MPNQKTLKYLKKLDDNLVNGKNGELLINLRLLGRSFENWKTQHSATTFLKDPSFIESLTQNKPTVLNQQETLDHQKKLTRLRKILLVWDDTALLREDASTTDNQKKQRQLFKYKGQINKYDRRAIHVGLSALTLHLIAKETITAFNPSTIHDLINLVSQQIKNNERIDETKEQDELEKIGLTIKSFQTPNKKKKLIKYLGILLALLASLACGLSTGGAIILLFPSLSITAFILGGLIALFGFTANFGFFSQNFPDFLLSLFKKGGITEYIDNEGNRKQLSAVYKYLLTPLAVIASLTVGIGTTALTYFTILHLVTKLLPVLAIIWPPLPLLIVGILAVSIGITLTVAVFTASLESLKKVAALNMGFKALCQHAYNNCIEWFKNLKNLKTHEKVGLVIMLLLIPIALAGLAYYRYTAGVDLSIFIGIAGSIVMGVVAYIAQISFTCLSVNKLKNALIKPFSSTTQQTVENPNAKGLVKTVFSNIWYVFGLLVNAVGNSVLVYDGSSVSVVGAVSCGLNSFTGNMSEPNMNQHKRNNATALLVKILDPNPINNAQQEDAAFSSNKDANDRFKNPNLPHEPPIPAQGGSEPTTPIDRYPNTTIEPNRSIPIEKPVGMSRTKFFCPSEAGSANSQFKSKTQTESCIQEESLIALAKH